MADKLEWLAELIASDVKTITEGVEDLRTRVSRLATIIDQALADYGAKLTDSQEASEPPVMVFTFDVVDSQEKLAYLTVVGNPLTGLIDSFAILSGPAMDWDFQGLDPTLDFEEFASAFNEMELPDLKRDYGIGIVNAIALVVQAMQELRDRPARDLSGLFEAGAYRVQLSVLQGGHVTTVAHWVMATSSANAIEQIRDRVGEHLKGEPVIIDFRPEREPL